MEENKVIKQYCRPKEAAKILSMSLPGVYGACRRGTIPFHKIGKATIIPMSFLKNIGKNEPESEK